MVRKNGTANAAMIRLKTISEIVDRLREKHRGDPEWGRKISVWGFCWRNQPVVRRICDNRLTNVKLSYSVESDDELHLILKDVAREIRVMELEDENKGTA